MRIKDVILSLASLALIGAGTVLVAAFFLGFGVSRDNLVSDESQSFNVPELEETQAPGRGAEAEAAGGPEDRTLWLTVPKMARIYGVPIPSAEGNDEQMLKDYAAIRLNDTGFPWEAGANVYIAGHRLGYPDSASFLAFYDLDKLDVGDDVAVTDADGTVYPYKVSREFIASPTDLSVTEPVEGKDVLTLQTCTLPDYSQRLIVQAEKVA